MHMGWVSDYGFYWCIENMQTICGVDSCIIACVLWLLSVRLSHIYYSTSWHGRWDFDEWCGGEMDMRVTHVLYHSWFGSALFLWYAFCLLFAAAVLCKRNKTPKDIRLSLDLFYEQTLSVYVAPLYTSMVDIVRLILSSGWVGVWLEKNNPILIWQANVAELRAPILRHKSMAVFK